MRLIGGALILAAALYVVYSCRRTRRERQALLWSLVGALGYMETAIRWQKMPLPRIFRTLAQRPGCGKHFEKLADMLQSNMPLQMSWEKAFDDLPCGAAEIVRRVELEGDGERLAGVLRGAQEELAELCRRTEASDRQRGRISAAAVLSAAGLVIILLL